MGIGATACGKGYFLLLVIVTIFILAFVTLDFHADDYLLYTDRKSYKIPNPVAILNQIAFTALRTYT